MKQVRLNVNEFEAYAVTVKVEGGVEEYAKAFLAIFNNVRECRELLSVENYAWCDKITVHCMPELKEATKEFLEQFGEITSCVKVLAYQVVEPREVDYDKYDDAIVVPYFEN